MRSIKIKICALCFLCLIQLASCANTNKSEMRTTYNEISSASNKIKFESIISTSDYICDKSKELKVKSFDNIDFINAYFTFPEIKELYILEYKMTDYDISPENAYNYMCRKLDELLPGEFSIEEKKNEIRFFDVGERMDENGRCTNEYPTFEKYKLLSDKNYPYIITNHPITGINPSSDKSRKYYLEIINGVIWGMDKGNLLELSGFNRNLNSLNVLDEFQVSYRTENIVDDKSIRLLNGCVKIPDAVNLAEKYLSEINLADRDLNLSLCVENLNILDINDNCHAIYFGVVPEYKGVKYNCILPDNNVWGFTIIEDNTNEREACGELIMCYSNGIDRYRFLNPASIYDIVEKESIQSIVSLESAATIASDYLTSGMEFDVLSVSAVYKSFSDMNYKQIEDYTDYENRVINIRPCWRFVLQPLTGSTNRLYYIFVDMITGKPYRTIQLMESNIKYG